MLTSRRHWPSLGERLGEFLGEFLGELMNVFGIDCQETVSVITLREGTGLAAKVRPVGDGWRELVPNSVGGSGLWGSAAARAAVDAGDVDPGDRAPWLLEAQSAAGYSTSEFWKGLCGRLYAYLGRMSPTLKNGYETVVALQPEDWPSGSSAVSAAAREAGLPEIATIPASQALLCGWLAESRRNDDTRIVGCISAGDDSVEVSTYRLGTTAGRPRVLAAASRHCDGFGLNTWNSRLLREVCSRFVEGVPPKSGMELWDAAVVFGESLCAAPRGRRIEWNGPFTELLHDTLYLSVHDCESWSEVDDCGKVLGSALADCSAELGAGTPQVVLVGGVGSAWPFCRDIVSRIAPVWQAPFPKSSVASGASFWPEFSSALEGVSSALTAASIVDPPIAAKEPVVRINPEAETSDVIPPWERGGTD